MVTWKRSYQDGCPRKYWSFLLQGGDLVFDKGELAMGLTRDIFKLGGTILKLRQAQHDREW